jgi:uncharacterized membrane protein YdjX (TVP38/TMEM64 family)
MGAESMETSPSEEPRSNKLQGWITLALTVVIALAIAIYIGQHVTEVETFIGEMGVLGPVISIALQTLFGASPIPTEPLTMINGAVFGPLRGTIFSWIGYMLASLIEYWIGMHLSHIADFEERRHKLPLGLGKFPADSPWFLMLARIVPGYGPKMVGLMGGMYRVPLWKFIWTGAIPSLIGAALFAYGGAGLKTLFPAM